MTAPRTPRIPAYAWSRVSALFDTARELSPAELPPWLARVEREQPTLGPWLRELLEAQAARPAEDGLERGPGLLGGADLALAGRAPGTRVGPWMLHALLGSGGMATVWRASRTDALPSREVALKLPLGHRAGSALAERFARERDILARLTHPHIARLYDAGVAEDGTPWLAMECVEGLHIDLWCDERGLGLPERVALFAQVLDAVQYAHARLLIHRDLKPSNILVTAEGQVQLLDFGIAKLLDDEGTGDSTALTQASGRALTPAYAAPEQLLGQSLTTAVDIYALGVVLFGLLSGGRPYRTTLNTPAQLEQAIADGQIQRASDVVSEDAARSRGTTARRLARQLRGDLDTILGKALRHSAAERYASATEFAEDLHRWAAAEPVRARPARLGYRMRRFVERNRVQVLAAGAVFVALVAALVLSLVQVQRANRERDQALVARAQGHTLSGFLMDLLITAANEGQPLTMAGLMARAEAGARAAFADRPDDLAQALFAFGAQRREFDDTEKGAAMLAEALHKAADLNLHGEIACDYGATIHNMGRRDEGLQLMNGVIADTAVSPGTRAVCLDYLTLLHLGQGDYAAALKTQQASADLQTGAKDVTWQSKERTQMMLAYLQAMNGQGGNPDAVFGAALDRLHAAGRENALNGLELRSRWASASLAGGNARQALALLEENRRALEGQTPPSPLLPGQYRTLGLALAALGRDAEALSRFDAAATGAHAGDDTTLESSSRCLAAAAALRLGNLELSRSSFAAGAALVPARAPALNEGVRSCAMARAELALAQGTPAAARDAVAPLLAEARLAHHQRAAALVVRSRAEAAAGQAGPALTDADAALALALQMQGQRPQSYQSAEVQLARADALTAGGDVAAAQQAYRAAATQFSATVDAGHAGLLRAQHLLAAR